MKKAFGYVMSLGVVCISLAGCTTTSDGTSSWLPSFSSKTENSAAMVPGYGRALPLDCPDLVVISGASSVTQGHGDSIRWQANLGEVARECSLNNGQATYRIGVEVHALLGAGGKSGPQDVPVTVIVKIPGKELARRTTRIRVAIPQGQTRTTVQHIFEDITFPHVESDHMSLQVGLTSATATAPRAGKNKRN